MSDNTPTERFDVPTATTVVDDEPKSKTLLYILIGVGALLLVAIIILIATLAGRNADNSAVVAPTTTATLPSPTPTQSESPTPSATPIETPEPVETVVAPPPPPPAPVPGFDSFSAPSDAGCQDGDSQKQLTFSWSSDDAVRAYIGVQTKNAKTGPYESDLPPVFTYSNLNYNCDQDSQYYTVTLEDGAGHLTHKTVTITK